MIDTLSVNFCGVRTYNELDLWEKVLVFLFLTYLFNAWTFVLQLILVCNSQTLAHKRISAILSCHATNLDLYTEVSPLNAYIEQGFCW